jgi:pilus assembly protein Flp/PilA
LNINSRYIDLLKLHRDNPLLQSLNVLRAQLVGPSQSKNQPGRGVAFTTGLSNKTAITVAGSTVVSKVCKLLNTFRKDEDGAAMAEYVVLLGLIVGTLVFVITNFAGVLQSKFTAVCASLGGSC